MVHAFVIVTYKYTGSHCPLHCRTGLSWPGCLLQHLLANQPPACLRAIYIATDALHKTTRGVCLMQRRRLGHIARTLCGRGVVRFVPASEATRTKWRGRSPCAALRLLLHQCTIRFMSMVVQQCSLQLFRPACSAGARWPELALMRDRT